MSEYKPVYLYCDEPDTCEEEHNEPTGHHYGCECLECLEFYYLRLK